LEDAACRAAALKSKWEPQPLIKRSVEHFGIDRVHHDFGRPGANVSRQSAGELLPGLAAINRFEQAAIAGLTPKLSDCRDIDDVRILRVRHDARNLERIPESDVRE